MAESAIESAENAVKRDPKGKWIVPPKSPGRPKGTRNEFGEDFIRAVQEDFQEHGVAVLEEVRTNDPATYLRVCAALVPKELKITHGIDFDSLDDKQLRAHLAGLLSEFAALGVVIDGQAVERTEAGHGEDQTPSLQALPKTTDVP